MNPPIFERARVVIVISWLLQSLWGCAAAQEATQGPWTRSAPMPTARSELAATALEGRIYVAGGIAQWGTTAAFEAYDPTTDRWEELPPLPEAVHHLAAAATNERIYITGVSVRSRPRRRGVDGPLVRRRRQWCQATRWSGSRAGARRSG
jgi:Kelch motif